MAEFCLLIPPEMENRAVRSAALQGLKLSSSQFKRAKFQGEIWLDDTRVHADARVHAGQTLRLIIPEVHNTKPEAAEIAIPVAYEDEWFWILDKPAPLPTASSARQSGPTLENAVYALAGKPEDFVYRPVNRLDRGTSGLMLAAKGAHAQHLLQQLLHSSDFTREYLAVAEGAPTEDEGLIDLPIGKCEGATVKREIRMDGKPARTFYRVLQRGKRSLLRLRLDTGRTHQIRVHLSAMGCPVAGDFLYGTELPDELPRRFALHSAYVRLVHPVTGQVIECQSPLPEALRALLDSERFTNPSHASG